MLMKLLALLIRCRSIFVINNLAWIFLPTWYKLVFWHRPKMKWQLTCKLVNKNNNLLSSQLFFTRFHRNLGLVCSKKWKFIIWSRHSHIVLKHRCEQGEGASCTTVKSRGHFFPLLSFFVNVSSQSQFLWKWI